MKKNVQYPSVGRLNRGNNRSIKISVVLSNIPKFLRRSAIFWPRQVLTPPPPPLARIETTRDVRRYYKSYGNNNNNS